MNTEKQLNKKSFLTIVAETMKGMISHEHMMAAIQRTCMRSQQENLHLMASKEKKVDALISKITRIKALSVPEDIMDVLVLRYLRNTQFLASLKQTHIDISGLDSDLSYWKKTMLFKVPEQPSYIGRKSGKRSHGRKDS